MSKNVILILFGIAIGACGATLKPAVPAMADGQKVCDYTHIEDGQYPEIGKDGAIEYDERWSKVLNAGWRLHTATVPLYVFERCK